MKMLQSNPLDDLIDRLEQDSKLYGLGHRNRFSKYRNLHIWLGLPAAILASLAASIQTASFPDDGGWGDTAKGVGLTLTWVVAVITAASTFVRPYELSNAHRTKATLYAVIRNKIFRVRALNRSDDELQQEINSLAIELEELLQSEPTLSDKRLEETRKILIEIGNSEAA